MPIEVTAPQLTPVPASIAMPSTVAEAALADGNQQQCRSCRQILLWHRCHSRCKLDAPTQTGVTSACS